MSFFRMLMLSLFLLPACGRGLDLDEARGFEEAQRNFLAAQSEQDYLESAARFRALSERGVTSGALLYNEGNCYVKSGRWGEAIAAYRRAVRYRPRDPYLRDNLGYALTSAGQSVTESKSLLDHVLFWQGWTSYGEKFGLLALAATLAMLAALMSRVGVRRIPALRRTAWVLLVLTLLLGWSATLQAFDVEMTTHGVVTADDVVARKGDAESYEPAFSTPLHAGAEFVVLEHRREWLHIKLPGDLEGWIPVSAAVQY
ncbi:MAG: tetratricopeptide repeat protein [Planctomycetota bacterium]